VIFCF